MRCPLFLVTHREHEMPRRARRQAAQTEWNWNAYLRLEGFDSVTEHQKREGIQRCPLFLVTHRELESRTP